MKREFEELVERNKHMWHTDRVSKKYKKRYSWDCYPCVELVSNHPNTITILDDVDTVITLLMIEEDGNVVELECKYRKDYEIFIEDYTSVISPASVVNFAKRKGFKIDYISYIAICYLYLDRTSFMEIPIGHLPFLEDLYKVLVDYNGPEHYSCAKSMNIFPRYYSMEDCIKRFSRSYEDCGYRNGNDYLEDCGEHAECLSCGFLKYRGIDLLKEFENFLIHEIETEDESPAVISYGYKIKNPWRNFEAGTSAEEIQNWIKDNYNL